MGRIDMVAVIAEHLIEFMGRLLLGEESRYATARYRWASGRVSDHIRRNS